MPPGWPSHLEFVWTGSTAHISLPRWCMDMLILHKKKVLEDTKQCVLSMALEVMNQAPRIIQINSSDLIKLSAFWFDPLVSFTSHSCRGRQLTKTFKYLKSELGLLLMTNITHFSTLRRNHQVEYSGWKELCCDAWGWGIKEVTQC